MPYDITTSLDSGSRKDALSTWLMSMDAGVNGRSDLVWALREDAVKSKAAILWETHTKWGLLPVSWVMRLWPRATEVRCQLCPA